jgi:DNA-binding HxlR family transcriptional regulator
VREKRRGRLLAWMRWPGRAGRDGKPDGHRDGGPGGTDAGRQQRHSLDWREAQALLGPVRHRWDLAIICNLGEDAGSRPADILAAVNSQSGADRQLSPQVLSGRLRELEQGGYIRHEDLSVVPLHRVYYLQPPGQALISDLATIIVSRRSACAPRAAGQPSAAGR